MAGAAKRTPDGQTTIQISQRQSTESGKLALGTRDAGELAIERDIGPMDSGIATGSTDCKPRAAVDVAWGDCQPRVVSFCGGTFVGWRVELRLHEQRC